MKRLKVLLACESSGTVRDAFTKLGHNAISCDLLPTEKAGKHYTGDVFDIITAGWDLMICHPPCTYLALSQARWYYHPDDKHLPTEKRRPHPLYPDRWEHQRQAIEFFKRLIYSPIERIAAENPQPLGRVMEQIGSYTQAIQPHQFGHGETKRTCLWLKNLPPLQSTNNVSGREQRIFKMPPGAERWKERSKTFQGIADAMAMQWAGPVTSKSVYISSKKTA